MPHQCTECSRTFPDGSKQMLAGCPNCGGNKFQFRPKGSVPDFEEPTPAPAQSKSNDSSKTRTTTLREWARKKVSPSGTSSSGTTSSGTTSSGTAVSSSGRSTSVQTTKSAKSQSSSSREEDRQTTTSSTTKLDSFASESSESAVGEPTADSPDRGGAGDAIEPSSEKTHEDSAQADARRGVVTEDELPDRPAKPDEVEPSAEREPRPDLSQLREELNDQFESIKVVEPGQYELNLMELYDRDEYIIALQENGRYVIEVPDAWKASE